MLKVMIDLPHYFLVSLMNDWLGVKGTMRLDQAMSDREQRVVLLEMLRSGDVCFEGLYWLWLRGVGVLHVFVGRTIDEEVATMALTVAKNSPHLLGLYIEYFEGVSSHLA